MDALFSDRTLLCADCNREFIFTAGEQLFFHDKQFKNDPKRCKPCKSRRSGLSAVAAGLNGLAAGISRTETRTECSECGVETTVPFRPTQGRPVLCRQCFQAKLSPARLASAPLASASLADASLADASAGHLHMASQGGLTPAETVSALSSLSLEASGEMLSPEAAVLAAASMAAAPADSNVATMSDLAALTQASAAAPPSAKALPPALFMPVQAGPEYATLSAPEPWDA